MTPPDVPPIGLADLEGLRRLAGVLVRGEADADDLAMDAVVVALEKPPRAGYTPRAWLQGIARRLAANRRRADAVRRRREASAARPEAAPDDFAVAEHLARRRLVLDALTTLPADAAHVLCLRYFDDLPPREIAARLGVPVETVRTRTRRALARLRDELDCRHGGDRAAWGVALAPLVPAGDAAPAPGATHPAPSIPSPVETLAVAVTAKPLLVAAAAAVLVAGAYLAVRDGAGREAPVPDTAVPVDPTAGAAGGVLAAAAPSRAARAAAPDDAPPTGPATGTAARADGGVADGAMLSGRVVSADGTPVVGAMARLVPDGALPYYVRAALDRKWSLLEATTGADGRFAFAGILPRDGYALVVTAPDHAPSRRGVPQLASRQQATFGDVVLTEGAVVAGRIVGADGAPVVGARVGVAPRLRNALEFVLARIDGLPQLTGTATTGPDGRFEVARVGRGRAVAVVEAAGLASTVVGVDVPATGRVSLDDLTLHEAGTIEGVALYADGAPAVGARVLVTRAERLAGYPADVAADGRFRIEGVAPGAGPVYGFVVGLSSVVTPSVETGAVGVAVRFGAPGRLEGRVVGPDGKPVTRFTLTVTADLGDAPILAGFVEKAMLAALGPTEVRSASGEFAIDPLEARTYTLVVRAPGLASATVGSVVVPAGAASAPVEVRLGSLRGFSGTVVDAEGRPLSNALVRAECGGTRWARPQAEDESVLGFAIPGAVEAPKLAEARTGTDGSFELYDLAPGAWALTVSAGGHATAFRPAVDPATVREPLRLALGPGATVTGRVTVRGAGPRSAVVVAISELGEVRGDVAADGTYRVGPLPPGRWLVVPAGADTTLHPRTEADREEIRVHLGAAEVDVTHGAAPQVDLAMPALPSLDVRLEGWPAGTTLDRVDASRADPRAPPGGRSVGFGPATFRGVRTETGLVVPALLPGRYTLEVWVTTTPPGGPSIVQRTLIASGIDVANEPRAHRVDIPGPR